MNFLSGRSGQIISDYRVDRLSRKGAYTGIKICCEIGKLDEIFI